MKNNKLFNKTIYQIYVRNYFGGGTLQSVLQDIPRLKKLGVDIVYLLPIHKIGVLNKKGSLGCPYSISDYFSVDPAIGSMDDLKMLINSLHDNKMQIMLDMVFNHTSRDNVFLEEHSDFYYHDENGKISNRVADWSDVVDLDYNNKELCETMTNVLLFYAKMGVDGFRCDAANLVPLKFWAQAKRSVKKVNKNIYWLSESIHEIMVKQMRDMGYDCPSESEMYSVFDMSYDYDVRPLMEDYFSGKKPLSAFIEKISLQDGVFPKDYIKAHNLGNHDTTRIASLLKGDVSLIKNWHAFNFFIKGAAFIYYGDEYLTEITPSLFEKEEVTKPCDIISFMQKLIRIKKRPAFREGIFNIKLLKNNICEVSIESAKEHIFGYFSLEGKSANIKVDLANGTYKNILGYNKKEVVDGVLNVSREPLAFSIKNGL